MSVCFGDAVFHQSLLIEVVLMNLLEVTRFGGHPFE